MVIESSRVIARMARFGAAALLALIGLSAQSAGISIMAWGASTADGRAIHVNGARIGCSGSPAACVDHVLHVDLSDINSLAFAIDNNKYEKSYTAELLQNAADYAKVAHNIRILSEVGLDDFWSFMTRIKVDNRATYLSQLIANLKSNGSGLKFGVTIYEDELGPMERSGVLPLSVRGAIDRVAFYLHYRRSVTRYKEYVAQTRRLFPSAKIYGGIYHYDRKDYIGCSLGSRISCSDDEEISLYKQALQLQVQMLNKGELDGLELYPGRLGKLGAWDHWDNPVICSPRRRDTCIAVTEQMGDELKQLLK